jgi:hypothetical protein
MRRTSSLTWVGMLKYECWHILEVEAGRKLDCTGICHSDRFNNQVKILNTSTQHSKYRKLPDVSHLTANAISTKWIRTTKQFQFQAFSNRYSFSSHLSPKISEVFQLFPALRLDFHHFAILSILASLSQQVTTKLRTFLVKETKREVPDFSILSKYRGIFTSSITQIVPSFVAEISATPPKRTLLRRSDPTLLVKFDHPQCDH